MTFSRTLSFKLTTVVMISLSITYQAKLLCFFVIPIFALITDVHCFSMYVVQELGIINRLWFMYKEVCEHVKGNIQLL